MNTPCLCKCQMQSGGGRRLQGSALFGSTGAGWKKKKSHKKTNTATLTCSPAILPLLIAEAF